METPEDNSELDKYANERLEKDIQDLLEEKKLKIKWRKELDQNEAIQNYFKNYSDRTVRNFVSDYVSKKYLWFKFGDMYKSMTDASQSQWIELAHEHLEIIQQKKLFDLQCLWRAEQIQLKGVSICFDFDMWEHDIFNCPFLEPITESDIQLYQDYLSKGDLEFDRFLLGEEWQNYDEMKEAYCTDNSDFELPPWYEFHNLRTGNTSLLLLPNIRGDKEKFYSDLYFDNKSKQEQKLPPLTNQQDTDARPSLFAHENENMQFFVKTFENKEIQNKYNYYTEAYSDNEDDYYEEIFRNLLEAKEYVPIKAHYNFKEAIQIAYNDYKCTKIIAHLPMAFEQYLLNIKMGFSFEKNDVFYDEFRNTYAERFMDGRELNGEERNLNF